MLQIFFSDQTGHMHMELRGAVCTSIEPMIESESHTWPNEEPIRLEEYI